MTRQISPVTSPEEQAAGYVPVDKGCLPRASQPRAEHKPLSNQMFKVNSVESLRNDPRYQEKPKHLFGNFCFEGETVLLGGTTNCGKSIFAWDIANAVAHSTSWWPKDFQMDLHGRVLIIDSEMTERQIVSRYRELSNSPDILRAAFWKNEYHGDDLDDFISQVRAVIEKDNIKLLIIDNISTISSLVSPTGVLRLFTMLNELKEDYGLTLLLITHTNKTSPTKKIEINDFRGSKVLSNLADTIVGIGNTGEDVETKYIKILKSRNAPLSETVELVRIVSSPYLHFEYIDNEEEAEILPQSRKYSSQSNITLYMIPKILDMKKEGLSPREIANNINVAKSVVHGFLSEQSDPLNN